jgi:hypothetical protein
MSIYAAYEMNDSALLYAPGHGLERTWKSVAEYVSNVVEDDCSGDRKELLDHLDVVTNAIEDLHELDPRGTLFRYPEDVKPAKNEKPRERVDRPPSFDRVNLADWAAISASTFEAVQHLLYNGHDRVSNLARQRGDPPIRFHETVMRKGERPKE